MHKSYIYISTTKHACETLLYIYTTTEGQKGDKEKWEMNEN